MYNAVMNETRLLFRVGVGLADRLSSDNNKAQLSLGLGLWLSLAIIVVDIHIRHLDICFGRGEGVVKITFVSEHKRITLG